LQQARFWRQLKSFHLIALDEECAIPFARGSLGKHLKQRNYNALRAAYLDALPQRTPKPDHGYD
jgi:hypothetical protein